MASQDETPTHHPTAGDEHPKDSTPPATPETDQQESAHAESAQSEGIQRGSAELDSTPTGRQDSSAGIPALHTPDEYADWDAEFNGLSSGPGETDGRSRLMSPDRDNSGLLSSEPGILPGAAAADRRPYEPAVDESAAAEPGNNYADKVRGPGVNETDPHDTAVDAPAVRGSESRESDAVSREEGGRPAAVVPARDRAAKAAPGIVPGGHPAVAQRSHLPMRRASTLPDLSRYAADSSADAGADTDPGSEQGADTRADTQASETPRSDTPRSEAPSPETTRPEAPRPETASPAAGEHSDPRGESGREESASREAGSNAGAGALHGAAAGAAVAGAGLAGGRARRAANPDTHGAEDVSETSDRKTSAAETAETAHAGSSAVGGADKESVHDDARHDDASQDESRHDDGRRDDTNDGNDGTGDGTGAGAVGLPEEPAADRYQDEDEFLSPAEAERRAREREKAAAGKPILARVLQVMIAVFFPIMVLAAAIRAVATPLFLWAEYHRPGFPADSYGFTTEDRMTYGSYAVDYLLNWSGPRYLGDLVGDGGEPLYLESEVSHMADVKTVLTLAFVAATVMAILSICAAVYLSRRSPGGIRRALFAGAALTLVIVLALLVLAILGWEQFFTQLHTVFFANGNWTFRLDDTLIRLFPAQFWMDAGIVIAALVLLTCAAVLATCWPTKARRNRDRLAREEARRRYTESLEAL